MKIALICCWSKMRIYPIYSSSLRDALAALTGRDIAVITTNCMCFDKSAQVNGDYDFINLPYRVRGPSKTRLRRHIKTLVYPIVESSRGRMILVPF